MIITTKQQIHSLKKLRDKLLLRAEAFDHVNEEANELYVRIEEIEYELVELTDESE